MVSWVLTDRRASPFVSQTDRSETSNTFGSRLKRTHRMPLLEEGFDEIRNPVVDTVAPSLIEPAVSLHPAPTRFTPAAPCLHERSRMSAVTR
jgi:hypothetical protein